MADMELLAPAGSPQTLRAVLAAGADAVYVGGAQFGARAYAKNFTEEELLDAIDYTHLCGKRLHLTVNTLLKNRELEEQLYEYFLPYYERGVDAVIVQDAGVFSFIRRYFPGVELHVSTQASITGADGARLWKDAGAHRIVLSRELSINEIRQIHACVDIELECFAHGALCYSYSGQCLFSSMLGGRSGNRGRCAQPCRLPYGVTDAAGACPDGAGTYRGGTKKAAGSAGVPGREAKRSAGGELYPLSLKDLCAIDLLPELARAGVSSLKIEGRMKQAAYAAGVTEIYRKYLDLLKDAGEAGYAVTEVDRQRLLALGNRSGFTDGYLRGVTGRTMISLSSPKHTADESGREAFQAQKRHIRGSFYGAAGEALTLRLTDVKSGREVTVTGGEASVALREPARAADVEQVLRQTGGTDFVMDEMKLDLGDQCFIPKQHLKTLRREALKALREELLCADRRRGQALSREYIPPAESFKRKETPDWNNLFAVCDTPEQLSACAKRDFIGTIALSLHSFEKEELAEALCGSAQVCLKSGRKFVAALPAILRAETVQAYEVLWDCIKKLQKSGQIAGFLAKNYDSLGFLRRMGAEHVILDSQLYTFSDRAGVFFKEMGYEYRTLPLELNAKELRVLADAGSMLTVYGHAPFMVSAQCVNKTISGCGRSEKLLYLNDRCKKCLPVKNYCGVCYNIIYNAVPTVLFDKAVRTEVENIAPSMLRMDFTVEDEAAVNAVLDEYEACSLSRERTFPFGMTRGHFRRGVE